MPYNILKPADLFVRMKGNCRPTDHKPAFTLILGSGFSVPIVPTTSQLVREDLPWWLWCQRGDPSGPTAHDYLERKEAEFAAGIKAEAKAFWQRVLDCQNEQRGDPTRKPFQLDDEGLPSRETVGEAYRFALAPICTPGLYNAHKVRKYFGDIIRRAGRRLNAAHFFLASIVAECPHLFGTVFTTNFDPLLQRSLQLFNAPYFVSDRPDTLQAPDDDGVLDALHLVYAHGSVYRYILASSPEEIEEFAKKNHGLLPEYFKKHAVLLVGFSGWDDAITRALKSIDRFNHNLYWCGRGTNPENSNLTADAKEILSKHDAFYVPVESADSLLADMHQQLVGTTLPRLFREPILVAREQLDTCDLKGIKLSTNAQHSALNSAAGATNEDLVSSTTTGTSEELELGDAVEKIKSDLTHAQAIFVGESTSDMDQAFAASVRKRFAVASDLYFGPNRILALPDLEFVVTHSDVLMPAERALARLRRGFVYGERGQPGDVEREIADYTALIQMPDTPAEQRAFAFQNRGVTYFQRGEEGDVGRAIADSTAVIEMSDASVDQRVSALRNRGIAYSHREEGRDIESAIADFTMIIETPNTTNEHRAVALRSRSIIYSERGQAGDLELAIADLTAVIEMPDASAVLRAKARINRGVIYSERGQAGDTELEIADYSALIDLPEAPVEQRRKAYINRGITYNQRGQAGDVERAIKDLTTVVEMSNVPTEERVKAFCNRASAYSKRGQVEDEEHAIADYTVVIEMPNVPSDEKATALLGRSNIFRQRGQPGDADRSFDDFLASKAITDKS